MRRRLYKYCAKREWAESLLDGEVFFNTLSYFQDYEDANVRRDENEGVSRFRPAAGLVVHNHTQQKTLNLSEHVFESSARADEIFVFCASTLFDETRRARFDAVACVEILNIGRFCERIKAALPPTATVFSGRVTYYKQAEPPEARWALPDLIAKSKLDEYAWQSEYRLGFSLTDALGFEKADYALRRDGKAKAPRATREHPTYPVKTRNLRDICRLREFTANIHGDAR